MEKKKYLKPNSKILSLAVYGEVCETELQAESAQEEPETMYGPPGIFNDVPLF